LELAHGREAAAQRRPSALPSRPQPLSGAASPIRPLRVRIAMWREFAKRPKGRHESCRLDGNRRRLARMRRAPQTLILSIISNDIVITMKSLPVAVRRIGNSLGIVIPRPVLAQVGLSEQAELTVERGAIVLRKPRKAAREGWSQAAKSVADRHEDELILGEFGNAADLEIDW